MCGRSCTTRKTNQNNTEGPETQATVITAGPPLLVAHTYNCSRSLQCGQRRPLNAFLHTRRQTVLWHVWPLSPKSTVSKVDQRLWHVSDQESAEEKISKSVVKPASLFSLCWCHGILGAKVVERGEKYHTRCSWCGRPLGSGWH